MNRRRWIGIGLGAAALLLGGRAIASALLELRWYESMGAADLWWARVRTSLALRVGCALAAAGFAFANLLAVRHSVVSLVLPRRVGNIEIGEEVPGRSLVQAAAGLSLLLGFLLSLPMQEWTAALLARYGRPFADRDPYLEHDLGFYLYWLPLETALYEWALVTVAVVMGVVILLYALTPSLRWERRTLYVSGYVRRHLTMLGGVLLLVLAWSYRLDDYKLLLDGSGTGGLFTSIDHRVGIPGSVLLSVVSLAAAVVVLFAGWSNQPRLAFIAVTGMLLVAAGVRVVAPAVIGRGGGAGASALRERPYMDTRAQYSRRAFAVDRVQTVAPSRPRLEAAGAAELPFTISTWDAGALAAAVDPDPASATDAVLGWRSGPGGVEALLPVMSDSSDATAPAWSVVRVSGWQVDAAGDPVHVGGGEGASRGALAAGPLVVRPGADGHALLDDVGGRVPGVRVVSRAQRIAYAWALQDLGVFAAREARGHAVLVLHRDVRARLHALVPFLEQGAQVTPIVVGDSLFWHVELYAASRFYPLSHPVRVNGREWSYFHRAAVALVQAQTGRTLLIPEADAEPLMQSWRRAFPSLFTTARALPAPLAAALPPASEQALVQTTTFARYGSRLDATTPREVPGRDGADALLTGDQTPLRLPDGRIAIARPVLDAEERLTGHMIATGGAERITRWQPLRVPGPHWPAAVDRLRAELRAVSASRLPLVRGPVRSVPVDGRAVLLQSAYSWRDGRPPSLVRVALWSGDSLRAGPSLAPLVGPPVESGPAAPVGDLRSRVQSLYDAMRAALRRGDLTGFGAAFDSLGRALGRPAP